MKRRAFLVTTAALAALPFTSTSDADEPQGGAQRRARAQLNRAVSAEQTN